MVRTKLSLILRALLAGALALAGVLAAAPTPAHAASESYLPPASGYWTIDGRGWGHGMGMSQWGAQGAAWQGLTHRDILAFYYPGTAVATATHRDVAVLLGTHAVPTTTVTFWAPPASVVGERALLVQGTVRTGLVTVTPTSTGFRIEQRASAGAAPTVTTHTGDTLTVSAHAAGTGATADGLVVAASPTASQGRWYRGSFTVRRSGTTQSVVNTVSMQHYLYGVVAQEALASFHMEALKAQAVAARSYLEATRRTSGGYDTCDTVQCQVYAGRALVSASGAIVAEREAARTTQAVDATPGEIRTYGGAPAFTQFSSSNGGYSVAGSQPYLVAKADPYSGTANGDDATRWTSRLEVSTVARQCPAGGQLIRLVIGGRDGRGELGGRITSVRIECTSGTTTFTSTAQMSLGMRNYWWKPREEQEWASGIFLSNDNSGVADVALKFGNRDDDLLIGDWNGDRVDSFMIRRENTYYYRNALTSGIAEKVVVYGNPADEVYLGDWDGDGVDTFLVRRGNTFFLRNSLTSGYADQVFAYGDAGDVIRIGDWNGDGKDSIAVQRGTTFYVRNALTTGIAEIVFSYGDRGDVIHVGDWNADGRDTLAVQRGSTFFLKNSTTTGVADQVFVYGNPGDIAFFGDWEGDGRDTIGVQRR